MELQDKSIAELNALLAIVEGDAGILAIELDAANARIAEIEAAIKAKGPQ